MSEESKSQVSQAIGVGIANALAIGALVYFKGGGPMLIAKGVGAAGIGGAIAVGIGMWLVKNGYTMEDLADER